MSKKIMLLAVMAVSAAAFAVPAMAMAEDIPLHVVPKPAAATAITGGTAELTTVGGNSVHATGLTGSATWETSTTGTIQLSFTGSTAFGFPCNSSGSPSGTIKTNVLPFHLVTLPNEKPGVLITPPGGKVGEPFASFTCGGLIPVVVKGNGVIGTITAPACGGSATTATVTFEGKAGVQSHKLVAGTETEYHLTSSTSGGAFEEAAQSGSGSIQFAESTKLECT